MTEYYTPEQLAYFFYEEKYDSLKINDIIDELYKKEYSFIHYSFQENKDLLLKEVLMYHGFLIYDNEYEKQVEHNIDINNHLKKYEKFKNNFSPNFFMITRLMLLFNQEYRVIKLRTLLNNYGYKKRIPHVIQNFRDNIMFYHLKTYKKREKTDINDINLDDMITFRL